MKKYSPSQVGMYLRCPASWMFRYAEGLKIPPPGALICGIGVHSAAELNHKQKISSHEDLPVGDLMDCAATAVEKRIAEEGLLPDPDVTAGGLKDEAVSLTKLYRAEVAPTYQPTEAESWFQLSFEGVPYGFTGRVDCVDDQKCIRDLKTAGRSPNDIEPHVRYQLSAYAMGYEAQHGEMPAACHVNSLIKNKTPKAVSHSFTPGPEDVRLVLSTLAEVHAGIHAGAFPPQRSSFTCSRRQCGFAAVCEKKYGGKVKP